MWTGRGFQAAASVTKRSKMALEVGAGSRSWQLEVPLDSEDEVVVGVVRALAPPLDGPRMTAASCGQRVRLRAGRRRGWRAPGGRAGVDGQTQKAVLFGASSFATRLPSRNPGAIAAVWAIATARPAGWFTGTWGRGAG